MSKKEAVLRLMKRQWVSPIDSLKHCHLYALSQRVGELIREGVSIEKRWAVGPGGARWREYRVKRAA